MQYVRCFFKWRTLLVSIRMINPGNRKSSSGINIPGVYHFDTEKRIDIKWKKQGRQDEPSTAYCVPYVLYFWVWLNTDPLRLDLLDINVVSSCQISIVLDLLTISTMQLTCYSMATRAILWDNTW